MKLSILIATVVERAEQFADLFNRFSYEINYYQLNNEVEIVSICDNKQMSIGAKRQQLLERASGEWIVFFDDDDIPNERYCRLILEAIAQPDVDCVGINGTMTTNGLNPQTWCHVLGEVWRDGKNEKYTYYRPIIHFNPVLRSKALQAGFKDIRYAEDKDYSDRLNPLLTKMAYIAEPLFHYNYSNKQPHKAKYGIK